MDIWYRKIQWLTIDHKIPSVIHSMVMLRVYMGIPHLETPCTILLLVTSPILSSWSLLLTLEIYHDISTSLYNIIVYTYIIIYRSLSLSLSLHIYIYILILINQVYSHQLLGLKTGFFHCQVTLATIFEAMNGWCHPLSELAGTVVLLLGTTVATLINGGNTFKK